jgi:hypothetical protein
MTHHAREHHQEQVLPDLHSRDTRVRLARMIMRLLEHWGLSAEDQCLLLGLSPSARTSLARYRRGEPLADNMDLLGRVGHLLSIHKSLRIIFPHDRDLAYRWVTQPSDRFGGRRPVDIMREGYEGVLAMRRHLDFERGR